MGRKRIISEKIYDFNFEKLSKTAAHPRERLRLLAFAHIKEGKSNIEIAKMLKVNRMTITDWIKKFNSEGIQGLNEKGGRGARHKLPASEEEAFKKSVLELQDKKDGGRIKGTDILQLIEEKFSVKCTLQSIYNTLHRVDLVWISGRSKHPKADPEAQEAFKKTSRK
jgi:transposase